LWQNSCRFRIYSYGTASPYMFQISDVAGASALVVLEESRLGWRPMLKS
jgi:hypothetical protein